jgi:hypothetical protein
MVLYEATLLNDLLIYSTQVGKACEIAAAQ